MSSTTTLQTCRRVPPQEHQAWPGAPGETVPEATLNRRANLRDDVSPLLSRNVHVHGATPSSEAAVVSNSPSQLALPSLQVLTALPVEAVGGGVAGVVVLSAVRAVLSTSP